jgi:hypothetical protein
MKLVLHIGRYVDEFVFRLNDGNVKRSTLGLVFVQIDSFAFCTSPKAFNADTSLAIH